MSVDTVVRPRADRGWANRLPLAVIALALASIQLYLARLNSGKAILAALTIALGTIILVGGYLVFLRRAHVAISGGNVFLYVWLGSKRCHAASNLVVFRV